MAVVCTHLNIFMHRGLKIIKFWGPLYEKEYKIRYESEDLYDLHPTEGLGRGPFM